MKAKPVNPVALRRYLERHIAANLPNCPNAQTNSDKQVTPRWQHVVVIPAYGESALLPARLAQLHAANGRILVLLVINRPDSNNDIHCNQALREAIQNLQPSPAFPDCAALKTLHAQAELYCLDSEQSHGPLPANEGVGLARKIGCDTALRWISEGHINTQWIHTSDADAHLPAGYFEATSQLTKDTAAATYPFWHTGSRIHSGRSGSNPCENRGENRGDDTSEAAIEAATALYELRLHHYVLGLQFAGSPYAFHTVGSCIAIQAQAYAEVRGSPKRAAAEDFYLLNKLAKTGSIAVLKAPLISLDARLSTRVPFGTGPAVQRLLENCAPDEATIFYHPACFAALRALLCAVPTLAEHTPEMQSDLFSNNLHEEPLRAASRAVLQGMGIEKALAHCRSQSTNPEQFARQFHQWFDGFRTLKFVHGIRDSGWSNCSLSELAQAGASLWPVPAADAQYSVSELRAAVVKHWGWPQLDQLAV